MEIEKGWKEEILVPEDTESVRITFKKKKEVFKKQEIEEVAYSLNGSAIKILLQKIEKEKSKKQSERGV